MRELRCAQLRSVIWEELGPKSDLRMSCLPCFCILRFICAKWDFPEAPLLKTPFNSIAESMGSVPGQGTKIHMHHGVAKE